MAAADPTIAPPQAPGAQAPGNAAAAPAGDATWPGKTEMEQWLQTAAMDADTAAVALRRLVQAHPGYGGFLAVDEDIHNLVTTYSKRFKKRINEVGTAIQPEGLYRLLCEVLWKGVGLVVESLEPTASAASATSVLPAEVRGQLRMLLQTNEALSSQLNELRRDYLRELSGHRDRHRRITLKTQHALNSLNEEPVMFYEPLNSLLDETTKDFVRMVVEERMKLEMKSNPMEVSHEDELANSLAESDAQVEKLSQELRRQRSLTAKEVDARKLLEDQVARYKAEAAEAKRLMQQGVAASEDAQRMLQLNKAAAEKERQRLTMAAAEGAANGADKAAIKDLLRQLEERDALLQEMREELEQQRCDAEVREKELATAVERAGEMEAKAVAVERKLTDTMEEVSRIKEDPSSPALQKKNGSGAEDDTLVRVTTVKEVQVVEKVVTDDAALAAARQELERHMQVEQELRQANASLEKALAEAERKAAAATKRATAAGAGAASAADAAAAEAEVEAAVANATKSYEKELKRQEEELVRLRAQLAESQASDDAGDPAAVAKRKSKVKKPRENRSDDSEQLSELMTKYGELERQYEDVQHEKDVLDQKVQGLLAKLRERMSDSELKEALQEIDLKPPPPRRKRKRNAFERLYDDAMRRVLDLRLRKEVLEQAQENAVKAAASKVKSKGQLYKLSALASLQRSAKATNDRFQDAMNRFYEGESSPMSPGGDRMPAVAEGDESGEAQDGVTAADVLAKTMRLRCHRCGARITAGFDHADGGGEWLGVARAALAPWATQTQATATTSGGSEASDQYPLVTFSLMEQTWGVDPLTKAGRGSGERFGPLTQEERHWGVDTVREVTPLQGYPMPMSPRRFPQPLPLAPPAAASAPGEPALLQQPLVTNSSSAVSESSPPVRRKGTLGDDEVMLTLSDTAGSQEFNHTPVKRTPSYKVRAREREREGQLSPRRARAISTDDEAAPRDLAPQSQSPMLPSTYSSSPLSPQAPRYEKEQRSLKKSESLPVIGNKAPTLPMSLVNRVWEMPKKPGGKHRQRTQVNTGPRSPTFLSVVKGQEMLG
eukprot:TRINITY_DN25096_c0_g1_i1.p1 TRINITY_DN25096_c0_g1~~TRINITY_DN25096_c0_g1_i1.p1  ORF type:complete len:1066 (-),score=289.96 TRINITY_DN25096_c0_g1_i1:153-3350(-)